MTNFTPTSSPTGGFRSFADILRLTFRLYGDHFVTFAGSVAIISIGLMLLNRLMVFIVQPNLQAVSVVGAGAETDNPLVPVLLVNLLTLLMETIFINSVVTYIASEANFGNRITVRQALEGVRSRLVITGGAVVLGGVVLFAVWLLIESLFLVLGIFALLLFGVMVYIGITIYFFIVPVFMLENVNLREGFTRAWALGRVQWWSTFGLVLMLTFVASFLILQVGSVFNLFISTESVLWLGVEVLLSVLFSPILAIAITLKYYDIRIVTEQIDKAFAQLGGFARPHDLPYVAPTSEWFAPRDFANAVFLTLAMIFLANVLLVGMGQAGM